MRMPFLLLALSLLVPAAGRAEERATTKDAERLVHKAVELLQKDGKEKAFAVFSDPKGPFSYRDLYLTAFDLKGVCLAHGTNKARIGKNVLHDKDPDGKEFVLERTERAKKEGKGWQEYKFKNPTTGKVEVKVAYFERVDDVIVTAGAYKP